MTFLGEREILLGMGPPGSGRAESNDRFFGVSFSSVLLVLFNPFGSTSSYSASSSCRQGLTLIGNREF